MSSFAIDGLISRLGQPAPGKRKHASGAKSSFLIRVQLCEERIRMQLTDHDMRVGVVLDLLRARCPGYCVDALVTSDGCEMEESDKIVDLVDYGECVVVTSGRTAACRTVAAQLSSFGIMSCMPRPCVVPMPPYRSSATDEGVIAACRVAESVARVMPELYVAINGDLSASVMAPVRLNFVKDLQGGGSASLTCRGGVTTDSMIRIPVCAAGDDGGAIKTVKDLQDWVRKRFGALAEWCRLSTHTITPPARPLPAEVPGVTEPKQPEGYEAPVAGAGWWSAALDETTALPELAVGQRLVVCTKSYAITVTGEMWPSWKCMPLNISGPERLQIGDKLIVDDPVRHEEISALLQSKEARYPWLKHMQRCGAEMRADLGGILVNDEVSFASVLTHSSAPGPHSAGRMSMKIVARPLPQALEQNQGVAYQRGKDKRVDSPDRIWEDESVWASLPPHVNTMTVLFTAGPHVLFCPFMHVAPVAQWLLSCPVQALDEEEMTLVYRAILLQTARALEHCHDHGVIHSGVVPSNLLVRGGQDMRQPLWKRMHVVLADYGLTCRLAMAGPRACDRGGSPGFWAPEQVPKDQAGVIEDRWGDSPPQLQLGFEVFIEGVYMERARQLKEPKSASGERVLADPDFPRLPHAAWAWTKESANGVQGDGSADEHEPKFGVNGTPYPTGVLQEVTEELGKVVRGAAEQMEAARSALWRDTIASMHNPVPAAVTEAADSFGLGMTCLFLIGQAIRARVHSQEASANRARAVACSGSSKDKDREASNKGAVGSSGVAKGAALGVFEQMANEWHHVISGDLGQVLNGCIRMRPRDRMSAPKIVSELTPYPASARRLWLKVAGNDGGAWLPRAEDEAEVYLSDLPPLIDQARARVYACSKILGVEDPQTRRAFGALLILLTRVQCYPLPDLSIRSRLRDANTPHSDGPEQATEIAQGCDSQAEWFCQKGPPAIVSWYKRYASARLNGAANGVAVSEKAVLMDVAELFGNGGGALPTSEGYAGCWGDEAALPGACASYDQWMYVRSMYHFGMVSDLYGRKCEALGLFALCVRFVEAHLCQHHVLSFLPAMQALRIEGELGEAPLRRLKCAAKRAWAGSIFLFQGALRDRGQAPLVEGGSAAQGTLPDARKYDSDVSLDEQWRKVTDLHTMLFDKSASAGERGAGTHEESQAVAERMVADISFPFSYPKPADVLHSLGESLMLFGIRSKAGGEAETGQEAGDADDLSDHEKSARSQRAYQLALAALHYTMESAGHSNMARLHAPLATAVKTSKRGTTAGPLLQQALVFAKKHVEVLLQGGCPGAELALSKAKDDKKGSASKAEASPDVPAKPSKGAGKGGVDKYENAYSTVSDTDLANAYVALAEVERLVGMTAEAGAHFTMAGDILLKAETPTSLGPLGARSGVDGSGPGTGTVSNPVHPVTARGGGAGTGKGTGAAAAASYTCAAPGCVKTGLFQCSSCKLVRYCSVDCQRGDWKRHKTTCKAGTAAKK